MKQPILTISILISNHYDRVRRCLDSIQPLLAAVPSELILTDTGCSKEVRQLLENYTDHIIDFPWCKDFSAARNAGLREAKGEWFCYLDDDEWFEDTSEIAAFLLSEESKRYRVAFYVQRNYLDAEGKKYKDHYVDRILRISPSLHFEHRIHEAYTGIRIGEKKVLGSFVHHYGYVYANEEEKMAKHYRNQELLDLECREHPNDMRMRYQQVLNPIDIEDWDEVIRLARRVFPLKTDSEYWDACHTVLLYALEKKQDWQSIAEEGERFLQKQICPYDRFGILQYMITANWRLAEFPTVCRLAREAIALYAQYKKDPGYFNLGQLMRQEHLERARLSDMLAYCVTAATYEKDTELIGELSTGVMAEDMAQLFEDEERSRWMEETLETLLEFRSGQESTDEQDDGETLAMAWPGENPVLTFDPSYFEGETRDGFYIEPLMKHAWAAHLEVLQKVDMICREHDIPYFADWGTLLGAIRHKGFIPWDDDIDICMLRADVKRFLEVVDQYPGLIRLDNEQDEGWGLHATKIVNRTTFTIGRSDIKATHGFPLVGSVDIFTVDCVPREKELEEEWLEVQRVISKVCHLRDEMQEYSPDSKQYKKGQKLEKEFLDWLCKTCQITFSQEIPTDQELLVLSEEVSGLYGEEDSDYYTQSNCLGVGMDYYISKEAYASATYLPFENIMIPVPAGYDELLRKKYGEDYMTPVNCGAGHDYPFYNVLLKELQRLRGDENLEETKSYVEGLSIDYYKRFLQKKAEPVVCYKKEDFLPEEIDGIMVTEDRKRIWAAMTEVMEEIRRICDHHELQWYVIGDTLWDAVRYQNYGPASEDLHLAMPRQDYMKFLQVIQRELDPWFDYSNAYAKEAHENTFCYVITDGYLCSPEDYARRFHGCPHVVGVDIAPVDSVDPDTAKDTMRMTLAQGLWKTAGSVGTEPPYSQEEIDIVREWKQQTQITIDVEKNLRREFLLSADRMMSIYREESEWKRITPDLFEGRDTRLRAEWVEETEELPFSQTTIRVPKGWREMIGEE